MLNKYFLLCTVFVSGVQNNIWICMNKKKCVYIYIYIYIYIYFFIQVWIDIHDMRVSKLILVTPYIS